MPRIAAPENRERNRKKNFVLPESLGEIAGINFD
jgi:hypothetical protein